jgi:hypothetical protein
MFSKLYTAHEGEIELSDLIKWLAAAFLGLTLLTRSRRPQNPNLDRHSGGCPGSCALDLV